MDKDRIAFKSNEVKPPWVIRREEELKRREAEKEPLPAYSTGTHAA